MSEKEEQQNVQLRALLAKWRSHQNLTKGEVARRMGVPGSMVSILEKKIHKAGINTILRYAEACGVKNPVIMITTAEDTTDRNTCA